MPELCGALDELVAEFVPLLCIPLISLTKPYAWSLMDWCAGGVSDGLTESGSHGYS